MCFEPDSLPPTPVISGAAVEYELVVYEGAPHSFFDRKQDAFAGAAEDAWNWTLEFIERHGK
jgi:carboxymethylenebutenolidase